MMTETTWQCCRLDELTLDAFYAVAAAREAVFVVEQHCAYQELDGLDGKAFHLTAWCDGKVAAYLRVIDPGEKFAEPSIGRVLTMHSFRRRGFGRELMKRALHFIDQRYPNQSVRISAQIYLDTFYRSFGFVPCSAPYLEDGIPHIEMLRS